MHAWTWYSQLTVTLILASTVLVRTLTEKHASDIKIKWVGVGVAPTPTHHHTICCVFIIHEPVTPPMLRSILCPSWHLHSSWQVHFLIPTNCVQLCVQSVWIQQQLDIQHFFNRDYDWFDSFVIHHFGTPKTQYRHYYTTSEYIIVKNGMPPWEFNLNTY